MKKEIYKSKTVQGLVLAALGALWGVWASETEISSTVVIAGLTYAGYGFRDAIK